MPFEIAQRRQSFLKVGVVGPAGAGKTFSALLVAQGLAGENGKIALVDTEHGSGRLYADAPGIRPYGYMEIAPPYTVDRYEQAIREAERAGYDVLIIDSISHAWAGEGGVLEQKDRMEANREARGMQAWAKLSKDQNRFVTSILEAKLHVICTMRAKTAYLISEDDRGRQKVQKVGLQAVQREGTDYELSVVWDIARDHNATASKDRTNLFDTMCEPLKEKHGERLRSWLEGAVAVGADPMTGELVRPSPSADREAAEAKRAEAEAFKAVNAALDAALGEAKVRGDKASSLQAVSCVLGEKVTSLADLSIEQRAAAAGRLREWAPTAGAIAVRYAELFEPSATDGRLLDAVKGNEKGTYSGSSLGKI